MRALITIPHYFDAAGGSGHGSLSPDPQPRVWALTQCLRSLRGTFDGPQEHWVREGSRLRPEQANQAGRIELDIVVCTIGDKHLLDRVAVPAALYRRRSVEAEPLWLGYACHRVLREHLGQYDLYAYLEDDLVLFDPAFFAKLAWFLSLAGESCLLQPNRFEFAYTPEQVKKVYIDFDLAGDVVTSGSAPVLEGEVWGTTVRFLPASNPHAGCFFLTGAQLARWASEPYFLDRAATFVGPLESAASLGIARTFTIYKPAPENASFFEIQHYGQGWSQKLGRVRFAP
jgi:hypothetical protein